LLLRLLVAKKSLPAPAVTRRKEYDQTTFGHILFCGMLGANVLFRFPSFSLRVIKLSENARFFFRSI
ncbi:MAG: hypothetical protein WBB47_13870, partial [Paenisporosarcina sp.]